MFTRLKDLFAKKDNLSEVMILDVKNSKLASVKVFNCFQTRAESTLKMFLEALIKISSYSNINKRFFIFLGDFPTNNSYLHNDSEVNLYYCNNKNEMLIPDFTFDSWQQAGINNYSDTTRDIEVLGKEKFEIPKMLWIGNQDTNLTRKIFMDIAQKNNDKIIAYNTSVNNAIKDRNLPYISLPEHTKYKYLIDLEGRGYSGRLAMLLFSNRVLFIQDREWKQKFYFNLVPYKHFIPVENDLSDLIEKINWIENKGNDLYMEIALNALNFAKEHLTYDKVINDFSKILLKYSD